MSEIDRVYDELLVILVRSGDRPAGERLAARWHPRLLRTARRLLGNDEQAQDAVQDTWAGICRGWVGLSDSSRFPAWAFGILHRKCADRIRAAQRQRLRFVDHGPGDGPAEGVTQPQNEDALALRQAFSALPLEQRAAAILFFGEGLSLAEISEAMSIPVGTAKSRLFHARRRLKAILKGDNDERF